MANENIHLLPQDTLAQPPVMAALLARSITAYSGLLLELFHEQPEEDESKHKRTKQYSDGDDNE